MKELSILQLGLHNQVLQLRNILRLVDDPRFVEAYERAEEKSRNKVLSHIENLDRQLVSDWIRSELGDLSLRKLRDVARNCGVSNYSRLSKSILLSEITRCQKVT